MQGARSTACTKIPPSCFTLLFSLLLQTALCKQIWFSQHILTFNLHFPTNGAKKNQIFIPSTKQCAKHGMVFFLGGGLKKKSVKANFVKVFTFSLSKSKYPMWDYEGKWSEEWENADFLSAEEEIHHNSGLIKYCIKLYWVHGPINTTSEVWKG